MCCVAWQFSHVPFLGPHSGVSSPYSSATHQASSPFWQSHIAPGLPRLRPVFLYMPIATPHPFPCMKIGEPRDPNRDMEKLSNQICQQGQASAVGKREKSRLPILVSCRFSSFLSWTRPGPTPPHGVVSLALGTVAWESSLSLCFSHSALPAGDVVNHLDSIQQGQDSTERNDPLATAFHLCRTNLSSLSLSFFHVA